ncbi:hypothetical protein HDV00_010095 [Rhizophlyctis rosea]|nr:hypothetical protein HDV00_010095 [Rhizophlyctis rosea]
MEVLTLPQPSLPQQQQPLYPTPQTSVTMQHQFSEGGAGYFAIPVQQRQMTPGDVVFETGMYGGMQDYGYMGNSGSGGFYPF